MESEFEDQLEDGGINLLYSTVFLLCVAMGIFVGFFVSRFNLVYIALHKVDDKSQRHGGEIVAEVLKCHDVKFLFTLPGGHISPILVGAEKLGIKVVDTRHEVNAVFAADAVARMSGTIGVVTVTAGPGLTNTLTAVKNAQLAESPILLLGGAAATLSKGRGALQDIDQMSLFQSVCKYCATVTSVRDIAPTLKVAIQTAQSGTPGPVFVELPIDVLYPYATVAKEAFGASDAKSLKAKIIHWYITNYVNNIFAGAWEIRDCNPLPLDIPLPTNPQIKACEELVSRAKKPVIIVGSQAVLPPTLVESLQRALLSLGIPCFLSGMARGLLGRKSPIFVRQQRSKALKEADVVILAGAVCDFRLQYGRILPKKSKIIAVNRDKSQLYKNAGIFWKPTVAVRGDVGTFLHELSIALADFKCDPSWLELLKGRDNEKEKANEEMAQHPTEEHLNPMKVLYKLEETLPDNAILIADGGDFVGTASYILRPRGPLKWLDPGAFGTLGVGGGFALGAKLCRPESEVWIIYGDGSCGYSIAEFDTFTRFKLPVMAIVGNDAGWTQIAREQKPMFGSTVACDLAYTNYHQVAEGFGGKGILVTRNDGDNLDSIFKEARELYAKGNSVLINVLIGSTKFREGSISV